MTPGARQSLPAVVLRGNFAAGSNRSVHVRRMDPAPGADDRARRCVELTTNDGTVVPHGEHVVLPAVQDGSRVALALVAGQDCGWQASASPHDVTVVFALVEERGDVSNVVSNDELTFRYTMDNNVEYGCADGSSLTLTSGGDTADLACGPRPQAGPEAEYHVEITRTDSSGGALPMGLVFDLMPPGAARQRDGLRRSRDRQTAAAVRVIPGADAPYPVVLRAQARRCCGAGTWYVPLQLTRVVDGQPVGTSTTHDVQITVVSGSWWSCYGAWVIRTILGLLALALFIAIVNLIRCVHLLPSSGKGLPVARNVIAGSSASDRLVMNEHPDWRYARTVQRNLGSRFGRWWSALGSGHIFAIARGRHWFETVRLNGDHEGITGMKAEPQLGISELSNRRAGAVPAGVRPGMYLRAGESRVINVLGVRLPEIGLIPIAPDDYNTLVRELRRSDPEQRELSRDAAGVVDIRGKYIVTEQAERVPAGAPLAVVVNTD